MAANTSPIFPASPVIGIATLTAAAAITTRTNIVGVTGLTVLTPVSTNGRRVDTIRVKVKATSVASNLFLWLFDGTTSYLIDELDITAVTAANTTDSFSLTRSYSDLILPPTYQLYVSQTVQTDLNVFAMGGAY
jgi:hypothetical protein